MAPAEPVARFLQAWTEDLYISGYVSGWDRLSDALNQRDPLQIEKPWIHGLRAILWRSQPGGDLAIDPFDLAFVLGRALGRTEAERAAKRMPRATRRVLVQGQGFEVAGTLSLLPGETPDAARRRRSQLFLPIAAPVVRREGRVVSDRLTDVALVNRYAIRVISPLDDSGAS
jgi:hypothetical protein